MDAVKDMASELKELVDRYPRASRALVTSVLVLFLTGFIAVAAGWDVVVAILAIVGILGIAVGFLAFTAYSSSSR